MNKLNALALGYAGAVVAALCTLLLSVSAYFGIYPGSAAQMQKWHMYYSPSIVGTAVGMAEAAVISFGFLYFFAVVYNYFLKK